jgi:hypothetical protein
MTYGNKPKRLLTRLQDFGTPKLQRGSYCAGFEMKAWRCNHLADHLMEWIADYALKEEELAVDHSNMYVRLREAAVRVYTSEHYKSRGEVGELLLHAICRDYFDTVPIAPRVFYLTASNDVVKSFDIVHVRSLPNGSFELWLGEAKFYQSSLAAIAAAVDSITTHIDQGFLNNEKLLLGPQISKTVPHYDRIRDLLSVQTSLDELFESAVFPVCIAGESSAVAASKSASVTYQKTVAREMARLEKVLTKAKLHQQIKLHLLYIPLGLKEALAAEFDKRLKGISA